MYRFFKPVIQPLLDAVEPSAVVEIGSDKGLGTELLVEWCRQHDAVLHSVDPLPKYAADEWLARWPDNLKFYRDLSLNALVDIGPVDFVCIDGDHNWYTVFHELEILDRSAADADQPFPVTLFHDVAWPYGRRDLYYDPETIPEGFRHPYRKAGIVPGQRALVDKGFNDHLSNAIHEGTPRNGVLTAVEDYVAQSEGRLTLRTIAGLHGLGIVFDAAAAEKIHEVLGDLSTESGLGRVLDAVEQDRIARLQTLWKVQGDLQRERGRVERIRDETNELRTRYSKLDSAHSELRNEYDAAKEELLAKTSSLQAAELRANRAEEWYRQAVVVHDEQSQALREQLDRLRGELADERSKRERSESNLKRLRGRRSVRLALSLSTLTRPVFRLRRGQLGRRRSSRAAIGQGSKEGGSRKEPSPPIASPPLRSVTPAVSLGGPERFFAVLDELLGSAVSDDFREAWNLSEQRGLTDATSVISQPLVSIIMPTYNRADVIVDAIASVREQTYREWELLVCDDASDDGTEALIQGIDDQRVIHVKLPKGGAARARNAGLGRAQGDLIAYLDSDNLWHPRFLEVMVSALDSNKGHFLAYCKYLDVVVGSDRLGLRSYASLPFDYDQLSERNYIDLNSLVHRRALYDHLGGFDERLVRQQDWELILRYSYLRDPLYVDRFLMMYRRSAEWHQITTLHKDDKSSPILVKSTVETAYRNGLSSSFVGDVPSVSILSWDISRNHFSKAYNIAEALSSRCNVQLVGFRFFDEPIFPPYAEATPEFETFYQEGGEFPAWSSQLAKAIANTSGEVIYAVKPRLPSLGVALLANYHFGTPLVVEMNDLESVVTSPQSGDQPVALRLSDVDPGDPGLLNPYGHLWTAIMEGLVPELPFKVTHNSFLDRHFAGGSYFLRNPKDEQHFDPDLYVREEVRQRLEFAPDERVLLFGGMVRRHKGVFELAELVNEPGSPYRLLVVGARDTPDQAKLKDVVGDRVKIVEPVDRNEMAAVNLASDAVVLWLDPDVAASQYQMPYKLTDALAMKVPVVANDIGDLGELGRSGYLRLVPFGDTGGLKAALAELFADHDATSKMVAAGRRLYLRQFSYNAVRRNLEIVLTEATKRTGTLPVAREFAEFFADFHSRQLDRRPDVAAAG